MLEIKIVEFMCSSDTALNMSLTVDHFYSTFFKEKVNALKFNFANTLALAFELKFVCAIFSRFTGSTVDRSEFHNSCFYINGKDLINHLMSEFV